MLQINTTAVCKAREELGLIYSYLDSLPVNESDEASEEDSVKIIKGRLNQHKARIMIIAAVSCFEQEIYKIIKNIFIINKDSTLKEFIDKMIEGKYFQFFNFRDEGKKNINDFYSIFGSEFKEWCKKREKEHNMSENIDSFMLLNRLRNKLAHEGYDHYIQDSEKSIYKHFEKSCEMLNWLSESLKEFEENPNNRS